MNVRAGGIARGGAPSAGLSSFEWIGNHYKAIGSAARPETERCWKALHRWMEKDAVKCHAEGQPKQRRLKPGRSRALEPCLPKAREVAMSRDHAMNTALLVIDVQQALCSGTNPAFESARVIDRINLLSRKAREGGATVVLIQHESPDGPLRYGTDGWQLADGLSTQPTDVRLRKRATDSFHETDLHAILQARGVTRLVICGLQSEFCVDTTTRRALALGYPVTLASDAHSTMDNGVLSAAQITAHHNRTLADITSFGPRVKAIAASEVRMEA